MDIYEKSLQLHRQHHGKIGICTKIPINNKEDLSLSYTPGVGGVCQEIVKDNNLINQYTSRGNMVAVVTDGSAVLGFGNLGPKAAYPVMEGKAALFKRFADIDAVPICLNTQNVEEIITIIKNLEPSFAGINLEDISAPRCFEIESRLIEQMQIPVFHDDQHGTAIAVLAGIINALKIVNKGKDAKIVINGAGAAGIAITKLLLKYGFNNILLLDSQGIICEGRQELNPYKEKLSKLTNLNKIQGKLPDALIEADIFIGVSVANALLPKWIKTMNAKPVIFAMANPIPEIMPKDAYNAGAEIVASGRSDFPNQINNVLVFPGIFRAALDYKLIKIEDKHKIAAAQAISRLATDDDLKNKIIIPDPFNEKIVESIKNAIKQFI